MLAARAEELPPAIPASSEVVCRSCGKEVSDNCVGTFFRARASAGSLCQFLTDVGAHRPRSSEFDPGKVDLAHFALALVKRSRDLASELADIAQHLASHRSDSADFGPKLSPRSSARQLSDTSSTASADNLGARRDLRR